MKEKKLKLKKDSHTGKPEETPNPSVATSNVGVLDSQAETGTKCSKCKGTGIVQCPGNSNSHTCWDCLEAGRLG